MKQCSSVLAVLALFLFSLPVAAQARGSSRATPATPATVAPSYGSYARTKLLSQARKRGPSDVLRLGAADRRALLTTGKPVLKRPERRNRR